jgi:hypothetical protein
MKMNWIEIIQIRFIRTAKAILEEELMRLRDQVEHIDGLVGLKMYESIHASTDISIILQWKTVLKTDQGSSIGMRLEEGLSEFGQVHRTAWVEKSS